MNVRFILVEPHEAGNVGAAARAMKNFDFRDLWIVGSRPQVTRDAAEWWAKGGADVVQSARHVATLQEALADTHLSIATTAVRGRHVFEQLTPYEVAHLAEDTLGAQHTLALVFGREEWGLAGSEIAMCQRTSRARRDRPAPAVQRTCDRVFCRRKNRDRPEAGACA
jgi:TrmH family RNA methyltransferase